MVAMATADLREIAKNGPSGFVVARGLDIHIAYVSGGVEWGEVGGVGWAWHAGLCVVGSG